MFHCGSVEISTGWPASVPVPIALSKPRSRPSQIAFFRALYPEITATLRTGHTLKAVHQRLVEDGVDVPYSLLRTALAAFVGSKLRPHVLHKAGIHLCRRSLRSDHNRNGRSIGECHEGT